MISSDIGAATQNAATNSQSAPSAWADFSTSAHEARRHLRVRAERDSKSQTTDQHGQAHGRRSENSCHEVPRRREIIGKRACAGSALRSRRPAARPGSPMMTDSEIVKGRPADNTRIAEAISIGPTHPQDKKADDRGPGR